MPKDDYAFPRKSFGSAPGMELRDWFAGMAMQGFVTKSGFTLSATSMAISAYAMAEAMLRVREMTVEEIRDYVDQMGEEDDIND
jgi:DNA-binding FadR family transcriptional regulator